MKCQICGKHPRSGFTVSHSMRHTKRWFRPNVRAATLMLDGNPQRVKVCTRCLRTYHKLPR